jgi:hypothetical protein
MLNASLDVDINPASLPPAIARASQLILVSERVLRPVCALCPSRGCAWWPRGRH